MVGAADGDSVGEAVGGRNVGLADGRGVGDLFSVGVGLGAMEGASVGFAVGNFVG